MSFGKHRFMKIFAACIIMILIIQPLNSTAYALDLKIDLSNIFGNNNSNSSKSEVNISEISEDTINIGSEITLKAVAEGVEKKDCQYSFYAKHESASDWTTLGNYSKVERFVWKPQQIGNYSVCIKIKVGWFNVYNKYFDVKVMSNLKNISYISTAEMPLGDTLTISGMCSESSGGEKYAFYIQRAGENWTELHSFSQAKQITWKPSYADRYSILVKVQDNSGNLQEKTFDLTVYNKQIIHPITFDITLLSPISAPYQWSCSISDDNIISQNRKEVSYENTTITSKGAYIDTKFEFSTVRAGQSTITMTYVSCSGKMYNLSYDINIDKNLNIEVSKIGGDYFTKDLPEVQVQSGSYSISVITPANTEGSWQQSVSDSNITELISAGRQQDGSIKYTFTAKREGKATVTLAYKLYGKTDPLYILIYNITIDDKLNIYTSAVNGNYLNAEYYPEIIVN